MLGMLGAAATPTTMQDRAEEPWRDHYDAQARAQMRVDDTQADRFLMAQAQPIDLTPSHRAPTWAQDEDAALEQALAKIHGAPELAVHEGYEPLGLDAIERSTPAPLPAQTVKASAAPQPEPAAQVSAPKANVPVTATPASTSQDAPKVAATLRPALGSRLAMQSPVAPPAGNAGETTGLY